MAAVSVELVVKHQDVVFVDSEDVEDVPLECSAGLAQHAGDPVHNGGLMNVPLPGVFPAR